MILKDLNRDDLYRDMLKKFIVANLNFNVDEYSDKFIHRRIDVRIRSLEIKSYEEYFNILKSSFEERRLLKQELTINVTHFYRDPSVWDAFRKELIPELLKQKDELGMKTIRIWSAGCSTGEEPLTIMICFREVLGELFDSFSINLFASDIDIQVIEKAKTALYTKEQFKYMPFNYFQKYFIKEGDFYKPKDLIFKNINYDVEDIIKYKSNLSMFDIITCRNTVIYLTSDSKSSLYEKFYHLIKNKGFLILGKTEIIQGPAKQLFENFNPEERFYRK